MVEFWVGLKLDFNEEQGRSGRMGGWGKNAVQAKGGLLEFNGLKLIGASEWEFYLQ